MRLISNTGSGLDRRELRNAFGRFPTGVAVVTAAGGSAPPVGITVSSFSAVSLDPPLVLWSLRGESASLAAFRSSGHFIVNVLGLEQGHLCNRFSLPDNDKFAEVEHEIGLGGCPALSNSLAIFECATVHAIESGDHVIFIGRVETARYRDGAPLVFAGGRLAELKAAERLDAAA